MTDQPGPSELRALVAQLDEDNERLRMRALELMELMERAVTQEVANERRVIELEAEMGALRAELEALHSTKAMRWTRPMRSLYAKFRAGRHG